MGLVTNNADNTLQSNTANADLILLANGTGAININNAYDLPTADGLAGQVMQTNGAGVASWAVASAAKTVTAVQTGTYSANINELVRCDPSSTPVTVNLPTAVGVDGQEIVIKNVTSSIANTIEINGNGLETIDGTTTQTLQSEFVSITVISDGANWLII